VRGEPLEHGIPLALRGRARPLHTAVSKPAALHRYDLLRIIRRTEPALVIPTVESTLVLLSEARDLLERHTTLAAPPPEVLDYALDKGKTLRLAARLGVPVPRSVQGERTGEIVWRALGSASRWRSSPMGTGYTAPPRTPWASRCATPGRPKSCSRCCTRSHRTPGRSVAALCGRGEPLALLAYSREREFPLSGGVSVLRKTIPLDARLATHATTLLREIGWHGVAMVEFKHDRASDSYTLMEINGRFQASTALSLDAGLNLPRLVAALYDVVEAGPIPTYRVGVEERWLRGDLLALRDGLAARHRRSATAAPAGAPPSRTAVVWHFLRDFRPRVRYDEFKWYDWHPGVVEAVSLLALLLAWLLEPVRRVPGYLRRPAVTSPAAAPVAPPHSAFTSSVTQRSIRA